MDPQSLEDRLRALEQELSIAKAEKQHRRIFPRWLAISKPQTRSPAHQRKHRLWFFRNLFTRTPRISTKRFFLLFVVPLLLLAGGVGAWIVTQTKPIPARYRQGLNYPLYYPANLPNGYGVDPTSFRRVDQVLIFHITTPSDKPITVSEQHMPSDLDLSQHPSPAGIPTPDQDNFTTSAGTAQTSFWGSNFVTSLVTPNTWIIINVSGYTKEQAELIAQSFRPL
jgi:hypothetical protein